MQVKGNSAPPSLSPPQWAQLTPASLSDAAYLAVRDQIVAGQISPGAFIRERLVSEAMQVSRTPLREAFGRLALEGFLEKVPHRGYRVSTTPLQDLLDLYPVVAALEGLAAQTALPQLQRKEIDSLRQLNRNMLDAIANHDAVGTIRANEAFHRQLVARAGNRRLDKLLDDLRAQLSSLEIWSATKPELATEAIQQHRAILQAVERRDYRTAMTVLRANRMQTCSTLTTRVSHELTPGQVTGSAEIGQSLPQRGRPTRA